uniref:Glycoside hydrolase family 31 N-terminal domain-containing protein n=1 Tax=Oryza glumipatula TaxID=40148 RepID=A0A0E0AIW7_9ORYZ
MLATPTHAPHNPASSSPPPPPLLASSHSHFRLASSHPHLFRGSPRSRLRLIRDPGRADPRAGGGGRVVGVSAAGRTASSAAAPAAEMEWVRVLEEGVFRFDASGAARAAAAPSFSFAEPRRREAAREGADAPAVVPACHVVGDAQKVLIKLPAGTSFYGTGEASGPLERTGKRVFTWNTDAWGFGPGTTSLYQSHPWVLAVLPDGKALGVLADTTQRCEIDLREVSTIKFSAPSAYPIITFGPFNTPSEVMTSLSHAIGTVSMPPKWSLGYQQCRWSYDSSEKVLKVVRTFREKGIPCDVVWMDIDYMDGFRCFTFDSSRFPDPKSMVDDLHSIGCKAIWMLDPGIKKEEGYFVYETGSENEVWIQKADGSPFIGEVWPGDCVFPDFTCKRTRTWWASLVKDFISNGVDGIWNDMNEPAVFKSTTKTMPVSNIHRGDDDIGGVQNHSYYHNVYGMLMARSTYEGMAKANTEKRPFVLTRAGFIGSQRYAATWTGDNLSNWEHLHMSVPMVLQLGLSGQPLSGPDIGGFAGNATPKLFGRWMGLGALFPFSRGHTETGSIDHEPWSFGEECEEVCRLALLRRYRLLPHIYTLFYLSHMKGTPVAAPVFFADPQDPELRKIETSFLLGPLLVCASTVPDKGAHECSHKLPKGNWLPFDFGDSHPDLPVLFLQGGAILPIGRPIKHVGEASLDDDLSLIISLDENGKAEGVLFEDAGDGYGFTQGNYLLTYYVAEFHSSVVSVKVLKTEGSWRRPKRNLNISILLGGGAMISSRGIDGEEVHLTMPFDSEVSSLVATSELEQKKRLEMIKPIPDMDEPAGQEGAELSKTPVDLKSGDWMLKVVPWIGGRIISMTHLPSDSQWLHSRIEINGYEEYSGTEYRSAGCTEEYNVMRRYLEQSGEEESVCLEGDIGGGLLLQRHISILKDNPKIFQIDSSIQARNVGAGSGGFSSILFEVQEYLDTLKYVFLLKVGEWMLVDNCAGLSLVNRFDPSQVSKCLVHWGTGDVNMELWSEERPVSKETPLRICHQYEVIQTN